MTAWKIDQLGWPVAEVETPYGLATLTFTDGNHAHAQSGSPDYGRDNRFTFREGKTYHGTVDVHGLAEGNCTWPGGDGGEPCGKTGQHDHGGSWASFSDAPPSYERKMIEALHEATRTFVAENPGVLMAAQRNRLTWRYDAARKAYNAAMSAVMEAEREMAEIDKEMAKLATAEA